MSKAFVSASHLIAHIMDPHTFHSIVCICRRPHSDRPDRHRPNAGTPEPLIADGLPQRLIIPMRGNAEIYLCSAQRVGVLFRAYRYVDGEEQIIVCRISDRYDLHAMYFWQRVVRHYVLRRVHVYRSKKFQTLDSFTKVSF